MAASVKKKAGVGGKKKDKKKDSRPITVNLNACHYPIIYKACKQRGWKVAKKGDAYDVMISDNNQSIKALMRMRTHPRTISPVQRVNHFPNMKQLFLKNCLARNLSALLKAMGPDAPVISPRSWCLPEETAALDAHLAAEREQARTNVYIVKPFNGLQGHGIRLTSNPMEIQAVQEGKSMVVQEYIDPPLVIDGFKFDMRLYVLITSVDPLKVYVFNDGLARLCTTPYVAPNAKNMSDRKAHLTNYSLNCKSKNFVKGADGSKRSIKAVMETLKQKGHDTDAAWNNIIDVIIVSILGVHLKLRDAYRNVVPRNTTLHTGTSTCYEVLGFDVMLDAHMKAWLIEVNHAPSFKGGSKVDNRVKAGCQRHALQIIHVTDHRKRKLTARVRKEWEKYFHEQSRSTATAKSVAERPAEMDDESKDKKPDTAGVRGFSFGKPAEPQPSASPRLPRPASAAPTISPRLLRPLSRDGGKQRPATSDVILPSVQNAPPTARSLSTLSLTDTATLSSGPVAVKMGTLTPVGRTSGGKITTNASSPARRRTNASAGRPGASGVGGGGKSVRGSNAAGKKPAVVEDKQQGETFCLDALSGKCGFRYTLAPTNGLNGASGDGPPDTQHESTRMSAKELRSMAWDEDLGDWPMDAPGEDDALGEDDPFDDSDGLLQLANGERARFDSLIEDSEGSDAILDSDDDEGRSDGAADGPGGGDDDGGGPAELVASAVSAWVDGDGEAAIDPDRRPVAEDAADSADSQGETYPDDADDDADDNADNDDDDDDDDDDGLDGLPDVDDEGGDSGFSGDADAGTGGDAGPEGGDDPGYLYSDDADDAGADAWTPFLAPMPRHEDEYQKVFSMNSGSDRAKYRKVIRAAYKMHAEAKAAAAAKAKVVASPAAPSTAEYQDIHSP